jgi:hypothetical protein
MVRRLERLTPCGRSAATERTAGSLCHSLPFRSHLLLLVAPIFTWSGARKGQSPGGPNLVGRSILITPLCAPLPQ